MVELRGILWRKMQGMKRKNKKEPKKEEKKPRIEVKDKEISIDEEELKKVAKEEELSEQEVKEEEELIREEEARIKEEKIKMYRFYDELNKIKLKDMGLDIVNGKIRCVVCKKWKGYTDEILLALIKRNGIDIIWKYMCEKCRKDMVREKVPEEYVPEEFG